MGFKQPPYLEPGEHGYMESQLVRGQTSAFQAFLFHKNRLDIIERKRFHLRDQGFAAQCQW